MFYINSAFLLYLLRPITWISIVFVYAIFCKRKSLRKRLLIAVLLSLLFFSNSFIIGKIYNAYEEKRTEVGHYRIGIVLGGFSGYDTNTKRISFSSSSGRFFEALKLYRTGKIDKILISGGNSNLFDNSIKEADVVANFLREIGVPDSAILAENQSRNTIENAAFSFKKVNEVEPGAPVLVITSAWHIPRARLDFSKYFKQNIGYYPANYIGKTGYTLRDYIKPSVSSFYKWNLILKEWVGLIVDRWRG